MATSNNFWDYSNDEGDPHALYNIHGQQKDVVEKIACFKGSSGNEIVTTTTTKSPNKLLFRRDGSEVN